MLSKNATMNIMPNAVAQEPTMSRKIVSITDDLMNTPGVMVDSSIMLHPSCRESWQNRPTWNVAHKDNDGRWYVRKGKRGAVVRYLTECEITSLDGEPALYQFKTDYLALIADFDRLLEERRAQRDAHLLQQGPM
jgi:hypothetical protein